MWSPSFLFLCQTREECNLFCGKSPRQRIFTKSSLREKGEKCQSGHSSHDSEISPPKSNNPSWTATNFAPRSLPGVAFKDNTLHLFISGRYCQKSPKPLPKFLNFHYLNKTEIKKLKFYIYENCRINLFQS